jgi:small nuclear ribonucleoprotein (snRNP)-like protein
VPSRSKLESLGLGPTAPARSCDRKLCGNRPRQGRAINVSRGIAIGKSSHLHSETTRADGLARRRSQRRRQPGQRAARPGPSVAERGGVCETERRPRTARTATRAYNKRRQCLASERRLTGLLQAYDSHCNLVLGEVEETIYTVDDEDEGGNGEVRTVKKQSEMLFVRGMWTCLEDILGCGKG